MSKIIDDVTYRIITVAQDDGSLDDLSIEQARLVAWDYLDAQEDWLCFDSKLINYNMARVWFLKRVKL